MNPALAEKILAQVKEDDLVDMACDVVNIPSPTGGELEMAQYMRRAFENTGLRVTWQEVEEGRANVIGTWEGSGAGKCLMFNGHMDTSNTGREKFLTGIGYKPHAIVRNGMIFGLGIYNMKGALVCYVQAVRALQSAGVKLDGTVMIAAVVGEIEKTQFGDEFSGKEYRGYGVGSHYMVCHGIVPDICILGEPTDMQLVLGHYGSLWVRISVTGNYVHTAFGRGREAENSIRRMHDVMSSVYEWIPTWEVAASYGGQKGIVNVGGVRGGHAWRASRTPERTDLYLDVRVPPTMPMQQARHAVKEFFLTLQQKFPDYGLDHETYVSVPGAEISESHQLVKTIETAHQKVTGSAPKRDTVLWCSDASVMTRFGIETLNYGPSSGPRDAEGEKVAIKTFLEITKIYALAAAEICGAT
ncbi:MAG TPA: M20/M25/M40 family metallo-hydrolase [Candidatus Acidoferrales bacterium]|nr:M20/M25/M40 family metallo-hydrolase [Candidatus Acidoferrales bacterium]